MGSVGRMGDGQDCKFMARFVTPMSLEYTIKCCHILEVDIIINYYYYFFGGGTQGEGLRPESSLFPSTNPVRQLVIYDD